MHRQNRAVGGYQLLTLDYGSLARVSHLIDQASIHNNDIPNESCIPLAVRDVDVVDPKEEGKETIVRCPGTCVLLHIVRDELIVHLLTEVHSRQKRLDQAGRNNRTTVSKVVRLDKALVIFRRQVAYPIWPVAGSESRVCRVPQRISTAWLGRTQIELSCRIGVSTISPSAQKKRSTFYRR